MMITPKQITTSQAGQDPRRKRKTRGGKATKRNREQPRRPQSATIHDPLFDALRAELGL